MSDVSAPGKDRRKRFLIGQLGSYGDCLYATTVARQIKADYQGCHVTWAIASIYRSILDGNPDIDEIWEFPLRVRNDLLDHWQEFENEATERKSRGDFDEIYLTQVFPNNIKNFDGTLRSSIFRAYDKPITVPVAPVLRLSPAEVETVRSFALFHRLPERRHNILFECSPKSGQSFVTLDMALQVSRNLIDKVADTCVILSSNECFTSPDERIIDGSVLSFRENAELTKYCTLLVGCSSGISWLCTSDWANPLPMIQLLEKGTNIYASFIYDHEYQGLPTDEILEMTNCTADVLLDCIIETLTEGIWQSKKKFHQVVKLKFDYYFGAIFNHLILKDKFCDAGKSIKNTLQRYGLSRQILVTCCLYVFKYIKHKIWLTYNKAKEVE